MSPDRMRASDREREEAVAVLRAAAAEGRLDLDELDERTATAYTARTRGELGAVLADIPEARLPTPAVRDRKLPRVPGRLGFLEGRRAPPGSKDPAAAPP